MMARSAPSSVSHIEPCILQGLQHPSSDNVNLDIGPDTCGTLIPPPSRLNRAVTWGSSWGVVTVGRGFNWKRGQGGITLENKVSEDSYSPSEDVPEHDPHWGLPPHVRKKLALKIGSVNQKETDKGRSPQAPVLNTTSLSRSPTSDKVSAITPNTPSSLMDNINSTRPPLSRSSTSLSGRRRSSGKRFSLVAGRISMVYIEPPSPPPERISSPSAPKLPRYGSTSSFISVQSAAPPSEDPSESFLGGRSIDEFEVEEEIGRGAYGLVKRARELKGDDTLGPLVIIKQIIKSRILADCWKKHPKYGTIPIEIYVMSAISSTSYPLPASRPWDPARFGGVSEWVTGQVVSGHPNICPLLDYFEDHHYYYLVLPYTIPEPIPSLNGEPLEVPPKDLFDLVEAYPQGLPASLVRTYLGQIADAMCFLHLKGIVHRDIKDENVVLGPQLGKCFLIDFGSSGVVRKNGWDTFSGTLDYAGPEILRGERYFGKEQDVWAFGVVAYVLLVGECPFVTPGEAQEGLRSMLCKASIALDERCGGEHELEGEEADGGGTLRDAAVLVRECLQVNVEDRPSFEQILESRFLGGRV